MKKLSFIEGLSSSVFSPKCFDNFGIHFSLEVHVPVWKGLFFCFRSSGQEPFDYIEAGG